MIREGLKALIQKMPEVEVVGEADNGRDILPLCGQTEPDVVIMDVAMPQLNGVDATRRIKADHPRIKVIALSMHSSRNLVEDMLQAGAIGYVLKNSAFEELAAALKSASRNQAYISPSVAGMVIQNLNNKNTGKPSPASKLTLREREVLQLLAEGFAAKDIAARLYMSENTVQTHRRNIMEKLEIHSIANLTKFAIREGITSTDD
jgi:DNA-binding NarL/FixJ family response regulator